MRPDELCSKRMLVRLNVFSHILIQDIRYSSLKLKLETFIFETINIKYFKNIIAY